MCLVQEREKNMAEKNRTLVIVAVIVIVVAVVSVLSAAVMFSGDNGLAFWRTPRHYATGGLPDKPPPQVGPYNKTSFSSGLNLGHIIDKNSPQVTNWTQTQINVRFTAGTGVSIAYDYTFSSKDPDGSNKDKLFLTYFRTRHEGDTYLHQFSTTNWTNFTLEVKFASSDPSISAYGLFNGATNVTGRMRINDTIVNGSHELHADIVLDGSATALVAKNEGTRSTKLVVDNDEWNMALVMINNQD